MLNLAVISKTYSQLERDVVQLTMQYNDINHYFAEEKNVPSWIEKLAWDGYKYSAEGFISKSRDFCHQIEKIHVQIQSRAYGELLKQTDIQLDEVADFERWFNHDYSRYKLRIPYPATASGYVIP